ncbi:MAG TPA: cell envelope integrity protein TolA [Gammaproteobacteria bacterium]|nr:cell envelope integrity protein TolA [Gammaproteobacteria bacterium]
MLLREMEQKIERLAQAFFEEIVMLNNYRLSSSRHEAVSSHPAPTFTMNDMVNKLRFEFLYHDTAAIGRFCYEFCEKLFNYKSNNKPENEIAPELKKLIDSILSAEENQLGAKPKLADGSIGAWLQFYYCCHFIATTQFTSLDEIFSILLWLDRASAIQSEWFVHKVMRERQDSLFGVILSEYRSRYTVRSANEIVPVFYVYLEWERLSRALAAQKTKQKQEEGLISDVRYFTQALIRVSEKEREIFFRRIHALDIVQQEWLIPLIIRCEIESFPECRRTFPEHSLAQALTESCLQHALFSLNREGPKIVLPHDAVGLRYLMPALPHDRLPFPYCFNLDLDMLGVERSEWDFAVLGLTRAEVAQALQNRRHDVEARQLIGEEIYLYCKSIPVEDRLACFQPPLARLEAHQDELASLCTKIMKYYHVVEYSAAAFSETKTFLLEKKNDQKAQQWLEKIAAHERQINDSENEMKQCFASVDVYTHYVALFGANIMPLGCFSALLAVQSLRNCSFILIDEISSLETSVNIAACHIESNKKTIVWMKRDVPSQYYPYVEQIVPSTLFNLFAKNHYQVEDFCHWLTSKGFFYALQWRMVHICLAEITAGLDHANPALREENKTLTIKLFLTWWKKLFERHVDVYKSYLFNEEAEWEPRLNACLQRIEATIKHPNVIHYFSNLSHAEAASMDGNRCLTFTDHITETVQEQFQQFCKYAAIFAVDHDLGNLLKAVIPPRKQIIFYYQQVFYVHREIKLNEMQQMIVSGYGEVLRDNKNILRGEFTNQVAVLQDRIRQKERQIQEALMNHFDLHDEKNKVWLKRKLFPHEQIPAGWEATATQNYQEEIDSNMAKYRIPEHRLQRICGSRSEWSRCIEEFEKTKSGLVKEKESLAAIYVPDSNEAQKEWFDQMLQYFRTHVLCEEQKNDEKKEKKGPDMPRLLLAILKEKLPDFFQHLLHIFTIHPNQPYLWLRELENLGYAWENDFLLSEQWERELSVNDIKDYHALRNRQECLFKNEIWPDVLKQIFSITIPDVDVNLFIDEYDNTLAHKAAQTHTSDSFDQDRTGIYNVLAQLGCDPCMTNRWGHKAKDVFWEKKVHVPNLYANGWLELWRHFEEQDINGLSVVSLVEANARLFYDKKYSVGVLTVQQADYTNQALSPAERRVRRISPKKTDAHADAVNFLTLFRKFIRRLQTIKQYATDEDQKFFITLSPTLTYQAHLTDFVNEEEKLSQALIFYREHLNDFTNEEEKLRQASLSARGGTGFDTASVAAIVSIHDKLVAFQLAAKKIKKPGLEGFMQRLVRDDVWINTLQELIAAGERIREKFKEKDYGRDMVRMESGGLEEIWREQVLDGLLDMQRQTNQRAEVLARDKQVVEVERDRERAENERLRKENEESERQLKEEVRQREEEVRQNQEKERQNQEKERQLEEKVRRYAKREAELSRYNAMLKAEREAEKRVSKAQVQAELDRRLTEQAAIYEAKLKALQRSIQTPRTSQSEPQPSALIGRRWVIEDDGTVTTYKADGQRASFSAVPYNRPELANLPAPGTLGIFPVVDREQPVETAVMAEPVICTTTSKLPPPAQ